VKRKILDERPNFDETELGFPKFSRFLAQAEEHGVVKLDRGEAGNLDVSLVDGADASAHAGSRRQEAASVDAAKAEDQDQEDGHGAEDDGGADRASEHESFEQPSSDAGPTVIDVMPGEPAESGLRLGPRRGSTRRRSEEDMVSLFEGQVAGSVATQSSRSGSDAAPQSSATSQGTSEAQGDVDIGSLGLPSDPEAIVRYLTHRYKGVGEKTAETLVERFGANLFETLANDPGALQQVVPAGRADQVLEAWASDFERRTGQKSAGGEGGDRNGGRRRGRGRSRGRQ
jgi:hypothetical protein